MYFIIATHEHIPS